MSFHRHGQVTPSIWAQDTGRRLNARELHARSLTAIKRYGVRFFCWREDFPPVRTHPRYSHHFVGRGATVFVFAFFAGVRVDVTALIVVSPRPANRVRVRLHGTEPLLETMALIGAATVSHVLQPHHGLYHHNKDTPGDSRCQRG